MAVLHAVVRWRNCSCWVKGTETKLRSQETVNRPRCSFFFFPPSLCHPVLAFFHWAKNRPVQHCLPLAFQNPGGVGYYFALLSPLFSIHSSILPPRNSHDTLLWQLEIMAVLKSISVRTLSCCFVILPGYSFDLEIGYRTTLGKLTWIQNIK